MLRIQDHIPQLSQHYLRSLNHRYQARWQIQLAILAAKKKRVYNVFYSDLNSAVTTFACNAITLFVQRGVHAGRQPGIGLGTPPTTWQGIRVAEGGNEKFQQRKKMKIAKCLWPLSVNDDQCPSSTCLTFKRVSHSSVDSYTFVTPQHRFSSLTGGLLT